MRRTLVASGLAAAAGLAATLALAPAMAGNDGKHRRDLVIEKQGYFFVGGKYDNPANPTYMVGQMYVEYQIPEDSDGKLPLILAHGGAHSGAGWQGTPDGRSGWADYFLRQGYPVYVIDQPGRAKSPWVEVGYGPLPAVTTPQSAQDRWSASEKGNPATQWPQAFLHTRWPGGTGQHHDPIFDQYYAHLLPGISGQEEWTVKAMVALLDKIGPAIIVEHSQPGPAMWRIADQRPKLVKAMVGVEPSGPPHEQGRVYGPSEGPLTYSPPITSPSQLTIVQQTVPDGPNLVLCRLQAEPARKLPNLTKIPTLMLLAESSYHAPYDHCTAKYLQQAGVPVDFVRLAEDLGIHGNGHLMLIEDNSDKLAGIVNKWLDKKLSRRRH
jgi:pimeloyl-ACP methyl ester carboxylesterase